ncbi:MAG TPA: helix-turn-helix transcriptional regulator, partial [Solirubrobacteraceae bacterium]|nr:helix-turn-helix transcriptional regulator [Solirubrobacteraceae bacterium]
HQLRDCSPGLCPASVQPVEIGTRLRERREALGLTQQALAEELGVTHQHVSRLESGRAMPSLDLVVRLAARFGITTDELLTGAERAPADLAGAIRADPKLSGVAKRHLIGLVDELRS